MGSTCSRIKEIDPKAPANTCEFGKRRSGDMGDKRPNRRSTNESDAKGRWSCAAGNVGSNIDALSQSARLEIEIFTYHTASVAHIPQLAK
jgi:hypothetical protein